MLSRRIKHGFSAPLNYNYQNVRTRLQYRLLWKWSSSQRYGLHYRACLWSRRTVSRKLQCCLQYRYAHEYPFRNNSGSGIRCIVTAALESNLNHTQDCIPFYVKYPGQDYEHFSMEPYLDPAADYIHQQLGQTNVLVHCMAGVSRSVTLIIAYLMKYRAMRMEDALTLVRSRRPVVRT